MKKCEFCFEEYDEGLAAGVCPYCGYSVDYTPKDPRFLPIGTVIKERYIIGGVLGDGGFGITYRAWDTVLQTVVAIKEYYQRGVVNRVPGTVDVFIVAPDRAEEFYYGKDRLLREAQIVSKFQSSAIVRVNDFFETNGTSYMVMEYLDSHTLTDTLMEMRAPFSPEQVTDIGIQICEALEELHGAEVLHRDIAPDNIFIGENGKVKIIDFGSARLSKEDTLEKLILVKEGFSPVEQYEVINPNENLQQSWTDLYALGATLYYCVSGVRPEESRLRKANVDNGLEDIKEPKELNQTVDENLNNTIMRAMAINSHERFPNAAEMRKALQGEIKVYPLKEIRKRKKRVRAFSIAAVLLAVALVIISTFAFGNRQYDKITLDPAAITIWHSVDSGAGYTATYDKAANGWKLDGQTTDAFSENLLKVIEQEASSAQFDTIDVTVKGISEDTYAAELEQAAADHAMPTIYQIADKDASYMQQNVDVSDLAKNLDSGNRSCYFLKSNASLIKEAHAIPTGFNIPVIYINTAIVTDYDQDVKISSIEELLKLANNEMRFKPIAVDASVENLFRETFEDYDKYIPALNITDGAAFLQEEAAVYLSDALSFYDVKTSLAGIYAIAIPSSKKIVGSFEDFWSISDGSDAEKNAAEVMLSYFFTENAQNEFYSNVEAKALPVSEGALRKYLDVYDQLGKIGDSVNNYNFR